METENGAKCFEKTEPRPGISGAGQIIFMGKSGSGFQCLNQLVADLVHIAHDTVIGHAENGGLGIGVDGKNQTGVLHAGGMVDGAGHAKAQEQLGFDHYAGLTDHLLEGQDAAVKHGTGAGG